MSDATTSQGAAAPPTPRPPMRPNAVGVTAAEFNGREFDDSPFTAFPHWLRQALQTGNIKVSDVSGSTDYAVWDVNCSGKIIRALPDDQIECRPDGSFVVHEFPEKYRHPSRLPK